LHASIERWAGVPLLSMERPDATTQAILRFVSELDGDRRGPD
jgi:hypothetical protein